MKGTSQTAASAPRRLVARLRSYHAKMVQAGYQPIVFEDYMDMLADQLNAINGGADALTLPVWRGALGLR